MQKRRGLIKNSKIVKSDYKTILENFNDEKFDLIFIDPPYAQNIATDAVKIIIQKNLLSSEGIIIIETDDDKRELQNLENLNVNICDLRKYGRVKLIFLNRKG